MKWHNIDTDECDRWFRDEKTIQCPKMVYFNDFYSCSKVMVDFYKQNIRKSLVPTQSPRQQVENVRIS